MHKQGYVHLDIKPGNILWSNHDNHVYLTDFGMSACIYTSSNQQVLCTSPYRPPELWVANPSPQCIQPGADMWGFGCVLYELVTGHRLFGAHDKGLSCRAWCKWRMGEPYQGVLSFRQRFARVPIEWSNIVFKLCAVNPSLRRLPFPSGPCLNVG